MGATDSRFFREKGTVAYGTGLFSPGVSFDQFASRFHGHDERIDVDSLGLCTNYWLGGCRTSWANPSSCPYRDKTTTQSCLKRPGVVVQEVVVAVPAARTMAKMKNSRPRMAKIMAIPPMIHPAIARPRPS